MRETYFLWFVSLLLTVSIANGQANYASKNSEKAEITIGSGTTTGKAIPVEPYYGYSYTQFIYLNSDLGAAEDINKISFNFTGSSFGDRCIF